MILSPTFTATLPEVVAVTNVSTQFTAELDTNGLFVYCATVASWLKQGSDPTAAATSTPEDRNLFVPANVPVTLSGRCGLKLAVVRDSSDGQASLTRGMAY